MYIVEDDYEALEKGFFVYDALYSYVQLVRIREENKDELEKIDRGMRFDFIKKRIKQPPKVEVKRPNQGFKKHI